MDISAVVVSYNSQRFLGPLLESLQKQEMPFREIVVVDNHSQDESVGVLDRFPSVRALKLAENIGYAAAANRGIAACGSQAVLVANADTLFPEDFSRKALACLERGQTGILAPLLLRFDGVTVDSAGQECSLALYPREYGYNRRRQDLKLTERPVFSACGAATVFTRSALERLRVEGEYYDEDFFMFWEDFDIGWRAQLLGITVLFSPEVLGYHFRSGTLKRNWRSRISLALSRPPLLRYHLVKNRFLCLIKNFRWRRNGAALPFALAKDLFWTVSLTIISPKNIMALARCRSQWRKALKKRRWIKSHE